MNYYNDNDPKACAWIRELIKAGEIPPGDVDERSINDVPPDDLRKYTQCHFFAGIGGWSLALRLAEWPEGRAAWTGSCPCQPFSAAGKQLGTADERHLWPRFAYLIAECLPPVVFGEQVASAAGRVWLAGVRTNLEAMGYVVGSADLCSAGVGAPHIRQRIFWTGGRLDKPDCVGGSPRFSRPFTGQEGHAGIADHAGYTEFSGVRERERERDYPVGPHPAVGIGRTARA